jgi:hypothetical protein
MPGLLLGNPVSYHRFFLQKMVSMDSSCLGTGSFYGGSGVDQWLL